MQILKKLNRLYLRPTRYLNRQEAISEDAWQAHVEQATHAINAHQFSKVVLANAYTLSFAHPISPYDLLQESLKTNLGCYQFLWQKTANKHSLALRLNGFMPVKVTNSLLRRWREPLLLQAKIHKTEANAAWLLKRHQKSN